MMMTTEVSGEGEGDESHVWYGVVFAVQQYVCTIVVGFGLFIFRIIDFHFTVFRSSLLLQRRASWIFDKGLKFSQSWKSSPAAYSTLPPVLLRAATACC